MEGKGHKLDIITASWSWFLWYSICDKIHEYGWVWAAASGDKTKIQKNEKQHKRRGGDTL